MFEVVRGVAGEDGGMVVGLLVVGRRKFQEWFGRNVVSTKRAEVDRE